MKRQTTWMKVPVSARSCTVSRRLVSRDTTRRDTGRVWKDLGRMVTECHNARNSRGAPRNALGEAFQLCICTESEESCKCREAVANTLV